MLGMYHGIPRAIAASVVAVPEQHGLWSLAAGASELQRVRRHSPGCAPRDDKDWCASGHPSEQTLIDDRPSQTGGEAVQMSEKRIRVTERDALAVMVAITGSHKLGRPVPYWMEKAAAQIRKTGERGLVLVVRDGRVEAEYERIVPPDPAEARIAELEESLRRAQDEASRARARVADAEARLSEAQDRVVAAEKAKAVADAVASTLREALAAVSLNGADRSAPVEEEGGAATE